MASNFIPLQEAAERLGVPTDRLVEMRSQGEIRGFRDGASWKFPETEIDRVKEEMADVLDEAPSGGSSLLVSEEDLGGTGGGKSTVIGGDQKKSETDSGTGSDLGLGDEAQPKGSDVDVVARKGEDQDVELVQSGSGLQEAGDDELRLSDDDDGELRLADDAVERANKSGSGSKIESDLSLESDPMEGSDQNLDLLDDEFSLASDASDASRDAGGGSDKADVLSGLEVTSPEGGGTGDLIRGDSDPAIEAGDIGSGVGLDDALSDDDLVISDDDDDDLVLGGAGSDISIAGDSGINLMSPSDSGLSLESEPLDLAGSSISALDLGAEVDEGGSSASGSGIGSGSLVDFQADEEFQLSPSGVDMDVEDDSGSQVIEVEDSQAFGSDVDLGEGDLEGFGEADVVEDDAMVGDEALAGDEAMDIDGVGVDTGAVPATGAARPVYEVPYSVFNVVTLACVLLVMCIGGMLVTDLMRNMWTYSEASAPVTSLTDALVDMAGLDP